uniref:Uncharacterized protein n=1 Tax=Denticeps clupeoides TaxID=299321 RepID=A0AAY4CHK9_9TELE
MSQRAPHFTFTFKSCRTYSFFATLTLGIVRQRYLEHVGRDWLSAESRQLLKRVVEDELLKMQVGSRRWKEGLLFHHRAARGQFCRSVVPTEPHRCSLSTESPDSGIEKVGNEEEKEVPSEEDEDVKEQKTSRRKAKGAVLKEETSEDEEEDLSSADEDAAEVKKRKGAEKKTKKAIPKEETSDDEDLSSADEEGSKQKKKATPAGKKKQNFASAAKRQEGVRKRNSDGDKKPEGEKEDLERSGSGSDGEMGGAGPSDEEEEGEDFLAVSRLKRYIALCGARRNYKKLLENCRSVKSMVAVLKKELEDLGVEVLRCIFFFFFFFSFPPLVAPPGWMALQMVQTLHTLSRGVETNCIIDTDVDNFASMQCRTYSILIIS